MSDSQTATSKKRKRAATDTGGDGDLKLEFQPSTSQSGPAVAIFSSVKPPRGTDFEVQTDKSDRALDFTAQRCTIAGENDAVEYSGSSLGKDDKSDSQYYVALYRPSTKTLVMHPAPVFPVAREVKALKNFVSNAPDISERFAAKNALGETFGTKKAKAAIRAYERNKVDVSAMEKVAGALQDRIDLGTENLPSKDEAQEQADQSRLIPPYDVNATSPEGIYPIHNIIPESEWTCLDGIVTSVKAADSSHSRRKCLPFSRSSWMLSHLDNNKLKSSTIKILAYVSALLVFRNIAGRQVPEREVLVEKMAPTPEPVIDGLLSRFTESARGSTKRSMTGRLDTLLLAYTFALCLKADRYATDTSLIAHDLKLDVSKVDTLFRSLGCTMKSLPSAEMKRLGLPASASAKRAVLALPLEFPKPKLKRRAA